MSADSPLASIHRDGGRAVLWDADLAARSPLFWPIARAMAMLAEAMARGAAAGSAATFPQPETIDAALGPLAGIRFETQRPVSRRRRRPKDPASMYDARITREGCVPTRPGSWHDLMNALVWATFPLAKRALHERQHGLVVPASPGESARRPRELDALALLDEGGLVVAMGKGRQVTDEDQLAALVASGEATALAFGHAIYEGIVLGRPAPLASVVCVGVDRVDGLARRDGARTVADADRALAAIVADRTQIIDPRAMLRLRADEQLVLRAP
jgi:hypothetical protein